MSNILKLTSCYKHTYWFKHFPFFKTIIKYDYYLKEYSHIYVNFKFKSLEEAETYLINTLHLLCQAIVNHPNPCNIKSNFICIKGYLDYNFNTVIEGRYINIKYGTSDYKIVINKSMTEEQIQHRCNILLKRHANRFLREINNK